MLSKQSKKDLRKLQKQAEKKLHDWQKQANNVIDQLEPEKKYQAVAHQVEKIPGMVSDFVSQLEPEKKYKAVAHQVEKIPGVVTDFVTQLEPEKKFTKFKETINKMAENPASESLPAKKLPEAKLSPKASKRGKDLEKQAIWLDEKYEDAKKKNHPIRNTLVLSALAGAGLAWNNQRIWKKVPALESMLNGRERSYASSWGNIYYKEAGSPENPSIVLVHGIGAGATSYEWRKNFEALSHDFHVYAYDLLGFGKSEQIARVSYTAELYIELLTEFLREVVKRPAGIVAASLSGGHAIQVANRHPELVEALVLLQPSGNNIAAGIPGPNVTGSFSYPILKLPILGQGLFSFVASRFNIRSFMKTQLYYDKNQVSDELVEQYYIAAHQKGAEHAPLAFFAGKLNAEIGMAFGNLQQPVLLIWGRQSKITPIEQAYKLAKQLPNAEIKVLENTRLACNDEKADQFNQFVREFLHTSRLTNDNHRVLTDMSAARG